MSNRKRSRKDAPAPLGPYIDNPDARPVRKRHTTARNARRLVITLVVTTSLLAVTTSAYLLSRSNEAPAPEVESVEVNSTAGKAAASKALIDWLGADPQPVAGGSLVSWDGATTIPNPSDGVQLAEGDTQNLPNYETEIHHFTVIDAHGRLYEATVAVETHPTLGARVVATPTLLRVAPDAPTGEGWGVSQVWPGYQETTAPGPVETAVTAWAQAFTSGDPEALRMNVGDPDATHSYMPLGTAHPDTVSTQISVTGVLTPPEGQEPDMSTLLVRVELTADLSGEEPSDDSPKASDRPAITYDLLVTAANTAVPKIVSWGGAGSGPDLEPFSVAIEGRDVREDDHDNEPDATDAEDPDATGTPTPTPTSTPQDEE